MAQAEQKQADLSSIKTVGILGSGRVGLALGAGFIDLGYNVIFGGRKVTDEKLKEYPNNIIKEEKDEKLIKKIKDVWNDKKEKKIKVQTLSDCSKNSDLLVLSVAWDGIDEYINCIKDYVGNKVIIDVTNPLGFKFDENDKKKMLGVFLQPLKDGSGLEYIQNRLKNAIIIKGWNIVNKTYMYQPIKKFAEYHNEKNNLNKFENVTMWIAGNDKNNAKKLVRDILTQFGWKQIIDAGDVTKGHYLEVIAALWIDRAFGSGWNFNHAFAYIDFKK